MKSKFRLISFLLLIGIVGLARADFDDGLNAYKKGNYASALAEWLPIAQTGVTEAQYNLAGMYAKGYGVKINDEQAVFLYKKAAEQGHGRSQYNLGVMYLIGSGTEKSIENAKHWLHLAYENDIDEAETLWNQHELWNY